MTFLELSHADLELPFGIRFLYHAYQNLQKRAKHPGNLIILFKWDFLELQDQLVQERAIHKLALETQKKLFDSQLQEVKAEFLKSVASAPSIVEIPTDIKKTK